MTVYARGGLMKKNCTECRKEFYPPSSEMVYKLNESKWQCSYGCYRKAKRNKKAGRKNNGKARRSSDWNSAGNAGVNF